MCICEYFSFRSILTGNKFFASLVLLSVITDQLTGFSGKACSHFWHQFFVAISIITNSTKRLILIMLKSFLLYKSAFYFNNYRRNLPYRRHRHQLPLSCLQLLLPTASHPSLSSHDATPWMKSLHCHPCQILCKSIKFNFILNSFLFSFCLIFFVIVSFVIYLKFVPIDFLPLSKWKWFDIHLEWQ